MEKGMISLCQRLKALSREWIERGVPSRELIVRSAEELLRWKSANDDRGIWPVPPRLLTATLDDGIGQGIEVIHLFAEVLGMQVIPLGLVRPADAIVAACLAHLPEYVGLTVLQLDSEEELARVGHRLPAGTCLIVGGPAFRHDPEMAMRCGVHYVAANVAYFIDFLLKRAVPQGDEEITAT
jgi:methylmalonyl-CoA mutase cobalamin-binding subunit